MLFQLAASGLRLCCCTALRSAQAGFDAEGAVVTLLGTAGALATDLADASGSGCAKTGIDKPTAAARKTADVYG